jgi:hypothetical protein
VSFSCQLHQQNPEISATSFHTIRSCSCVLGKILITPLMYEVMYQGKWAWSFKGDSGPYIGGRDRRNRIWKAEGRAGSPDINPTMCKGQRSIRHIGSAKAIDSNERRVILDGSWAFYLVIHSRPAMCHARALCHNHLFIATFCNGTSPYRVVTSSQSEIVSPNLECNASDKPSVSLAQLRCLEISNAKVARKPVSPLPNVRAPFASPRRDTLRAVTTPYELTTVH